MTPGGPALGAMALPFPLALGACPTGRLVAEVLIDLSPAGELETRCFVAQGAERRLLWRSARVTPTAEGTQVSWRTDSGQLAVSQFRTVIVADLEGAVWRHRFADPVSALLHESEGNLLVLAGKTLHRCPRPAEGPIGATETLRTAVRAVTLAAGIVHLAVEADEAIAVAPLVGTQVARYSVAGRDLDSVTLRGTADGTMFIELRDRPVSGRSRTTLIRCDDGRAFFDGAIGVGIAEPSVHWHILTRDALALVGEIDSVAGLWWIGASGERRPLTDPALEVEWASWSPGAESVVVGGRDLIRPGERRSQCLAADGTLLWERMGGALLAEWIDGRRFAWAVESGGTKVGWILAEAGLAGAGPLAAEPRRPVRTTLLPGPSPTASRMVLVGAAASPRVGIVYAMGPHRFFPCGAERLFYHHAIRAQAEAACADGGLLIGLNGSGALGGGPERRLPADPAYDEAAVAEIAAAVEHLRRSGSSRIVLVAASLGCLPAIRFLAGQDLDGAALLNPVYTSDIPPLRPWRALYGTGSRLDAALDDYAAAIRTPLLIVHGLRDPISPSQHSSDFVMALPEDLACEYVSVPDEGHIFQTDPGWRALLESTRLFLRRAFEPASEAAA